MTEKNIQCSLVDMGRTTASWAQGRHGFDDIVGSRHRGLREDYVVPGLGTT
jgi:hypothetical protein